MLLEAQDRSLWNRPMISEGLALIDAALRMQRLGPYQVQAAIAAVHAQAARAEDTDWSEIDRLYAVLETLQPSPVITLNRAVAVSRVHGPAAALDHDRTTGRHTGRIFSLPWVKGALLLQLGREDERGRSNARFAGKYRGRGDAHPHAYRSAQWQRRIRGRPQASTSAHRFHIPLRQDVRPVDPTSVGLLLVRPSRTHDPTGSRPTRRKDAGTMVFVNPSSACCRLPAR